MDLSKTIREAYPEITDDEFIIGRILLQNDGDGIVYIKKWEYPQPIPAGLVLGKPSS